MMGTGGKGRRRMLMGMLRTGVGGGGGNDVSTRSSDGSGATAYGRGDEIRVVCGVGGSLVGNIVDVKTNQGRDQRWRMPT